MKQEYFVNEIEMREVVVGLWSTGSVSGGWGMDDQQNCQIRSPRSNNRGLQRVGLRMGWMVLEVEGI